MNSDLQAFVRDALARGAAPDAIRAALARARWRPDEIDAALAAWEDAGLGVPVPRRRVQLSAREAFLYLVMFATLYWVAYHTGAILWTAIERALPDPASRFPEFSSYDWRGGVRMSVASLLVAFPVFLWTSRLLGRAMAQDPEKRSSGVRRWLTYLTLFNAACVLIGDFIAVVLAFLNGELGSRFLLKALVVGGIAGFLFLHYLGGLRRDEGESAAAPAHAGWLPRAAGAAVLAVLALGFVLGGSPGRARGQQLDRQRVECLQATSRAVQTYAGRHARLPAALADLEERTPDRIVDPAMLRDPVTHAWYGYRSLDSLSFELCATFVTRDSVGPGGPGVDEFWRHGTGRTCFRFPRKPGPG